MSTQGEGPVARFPVAVWQQVPVVRTVAHTIKYRGISRTVQWPAALRRHGQPAAGVTRSRPSSEVPYEPATPSMIGRMK